MNENSVNDKNKCSSYASIGNSKTVGRQFSITHYNLKIMYIHIYIRICVCIFNHIIAGEQHLLKMFI